MKRAMDVKQVWSALDKGLKVYWSNDAYQVVVETADCEYQYNHFTNRNGKVLCIRHTENWFGGLMDQAELGALFLKIEV